MATVGLQLPSSAPQGVPPQKWYHSIPFRLAMAMAGNTFLALTIVLFFNESTEFRQWIAALLLTVLSGGFGFFVAQPVSQAFRELSRALDQLGTGDLTVRAGTHHTGELGQLAWRLNLLAEQLAVMYQQTHSRLLDHDLQHRELEERSRELEASQRVTFAASERVSPSELLSLVVNLIRDQFNLYHVQVFLVDAARQMAVLAESTGYAGRQLLQQKYQVALDSGSLVARAIQEGKPVLVPDVEADSDYQPNALLAETRSHLVVPLLVGGQVMGVLDIQDRIAHRFSERTIALFQTMAQQVAFLFENSDLLARTVQQTEAVNRFMVQLRTAAEIANRIGSILDLDRLLGEVVELMQSRFGLYHVHIYLLDEAEENLVVRAGSGEVGRVLRERHHQLSLNQQKSVVSRAARERGPVVVNDTALESDFVPNPLLPQTRSELAVPLIAAGKVLGVLDVQDDQVDRFAETDLDTFNTLAGQIATALQNARSFAAQERLQEELHRSERKFREIIRRALVGIFRTTPTGVVLEANPRMLEILKFDSLEAINQAGLTDLYVVPEERQQLFAAALQGPVAGFETQLWRSDGVAVPISISAMMVPDEQGRPAFLEGTFEDISERKEAEEKLRQSEAQLRGTLAAMPTPMVITRYGDSVVLYANAPFAELIGEPVESLLGHRVPELYGREHIEPIRAEFEATGCLKRYEFLARRKDGSTFWTVLSAYPVQFGGENALLFTLYDVTPIRAAQEAQTRFANQLSTAAEIAMQIGNILDPEVLMETVIPLIKERFNLYHVHFYMLDEAAQDLVLRAGYGEPGRIMRERGHRIALNREQSLVARAARTREIVVVGDVTQAPDFLPNSLLPHTRSEVAVPLLAGDRLLGVFDVQDDEAERFGASDLDVFRTLAGQFATAWQNAGLFERVEANLQETRVRFEVSQSLANAQTEAEVLDRLIEHARLYPQVRAAIYEVQNGGTDECVFISRRDAPFDTGLVGAPLNTRMTPAQFGIFGLVRPNEVFVCDNLETDPRVDLNARETVRKMGLVSTVIVPMVIGDEWMGIVAGSSKIEGYFDEAKVRLYRALAEQGAVALRAARLRHAAQESAAKLRAIFDAITDGIAVSDLNGQLVECNEAQARMTGYASRDELLALNSVQAIAPGQEEWIKKEIHRTIEVGSSGLVEYTLVRKDGSTFAGDISSTLLRDVEGNPTGLVGIVRDITERKRIEMERERLLQETQARLLVSQALSGAQTEEEALDAIIKVLSAHAHMHATVFTLDQNAGELTLISRRKYTFEDSSIASRIPLGYRFPASRFTMLELVAHESVFVSANGLEDPRVDEASRVNLVNMGGKSMAAIMLRHGENPLGLVFLTSELEGYFDDSKLLLYRSLAELGAQVLHAVQLRDALMMTQFSVDESAESMLWISPDARIVNVNKAACENLGYSHQELLGMTVFDFDPDFPRDGWAAHWEELRTRKTFSLETRHRTKDGRVFPVEMTVNYIEYAGKEYNCAFARNITERRQVQAEREQMLQETQVRLQVSQALISAHTEEEVLDTLIQVVGIYPHMQATLFTIDKQAEELTLVSRRKHVVEGCAVVSRVPLGFRFPASRFPMLGLVANSPVFVSDNGLEDPRLDEPSRANLVNMGGKSMAAIMLRHGEDPLGLIVLVSEIEGYFDEPKLMLYRSLAEQGAVALRTTQLWDTLQLTQFSVDEASESMFWLSPEGRFLNVNRTICEKLGYTRQELLSLGIADLNPSYDPETWSAHWEDLKVRKSITLESQHRTKDGRFIPIEVTINYIAYGSQEYSCAFARDITERKQVQAERERVLEETQIRLKVSQTLADARGEEATLDAMVQLGAMYPEIQMGLFTFDPQAGEPTVVARRWEDFESGITSAMPLGARSPLRQFAMFLLVTPHTCFVTPDFQVDDRIDPETKQAMSTGGTRAMAVVPISVGNDMIGLITLFSRNVGEFDERKLHLYRTLAEQGAVSLRAAQLQDALQMTQMSVDSAKDAMFWADTEMNFIETNPAASDLLGYSKPALLTMDAFDIQRAVSREAWVEMREELRTVGVVNIEVAYYTNYGTEVPVDVTIQRMEFNGQELFFAMARDISERKQAEAERERLVSVLDSTPDIVAMADTSGRTFYLNRAARELIGVPDGAPIENYSLSDINTPEAMEEMATLALPIAMRDGIWQGEGSAKTLDGEVIPLSTVILVKKDAQGNPLYVAGIGRDIRERKRAELERERFTAQLSTAAEIAGRVTNILEPDALLNEVVILLKERFNFYHVHFYALDAAGEGLVLQAGYGEPGRIMLERGHRIPMDREQSLVARAARSREVVVVDDVTTAPDFMPNPLLPDTRSEVAIPVVSGNRVLGVFDVQDDEVARFGAADLDVFRTLAGQLATALQNARLFERVEANLRETQVRYDVSQLLANAQTEVEVLDGLIENGRLYPQARMSILEVVEQKDDVGSSYILRRDAPFDTGMAGIPEGSLLTAQEFSLVSLFRPDEVFISNNVYADPRIDAASLEVARQVGYISLIVVPMTVGNEWLGSLVFESKLEGYFDETKVQLYRTLAEQGAGALRAARLRAALRESEEQLHTFVSNVPGVFFAVDLAGRLTLSEGKGLASFGLQGGQLVGQLMDELYKDAPDVLAALQRALKGETFQAITHVNSLWFETSYAPLHNREGQLVGSIGVSIDITERQRVEAERERLSTIVESTTDYIGIVTPEGQGVYFNKAGRNALGMSEDVPASEYTIASMVSPEEMARINEEVIPIAIEQGVWRGESSLRTMEGRDIPVMTVVITKKDEQGNVLYLANISHDITELKRTATEAREAAAKIRAMFDSISDGITFTDLQGQIIDANRGTLKLHGYDSVEELLGRTSLGFVAEPEHPRAYANLAKTVETGHSGEIEYRLRRKDGSTFDGELSATMVRGADGNPIGFIAVSRDVSERKRAEVERAHFTTRLRTAADITSQVGTILDPDQLLELVIPLLKERFDLYHVHFYALDEAAHELVLKAGYGEPGRIMLEQGHRIPLDREQSLVARAARTRERVVVGDVVAAPDFMPNPLLPDTRSEVAVPAIASGRVLGVFDVQQNRPDAFTEADLNVFQTLAGQIAGALQNAELYRQSQDERAFYDGILTNLPIGVWAVDNQFNVRLVNPAGRLMMGREVTNELGDSSYVEAYGVVNYETGEPYDNNSLPLVKAVTRGEKHTISDAAILWPDGTRIPMMINAAPLLDVEGKQTGGVVIFADITEQKKAQVEVQRLLDETQVRLQVSEMLVSAHTEEETLDMMIQVLGIYSNMYATVFTVDHQTGELALISRRQHTFEGCHIVPPVPVGTRFPASQFTMLELVANDAVFVTGNGLEDPRVDPASRGNLVYMGGKSMAAIMLRHAGEPIGLIFLMSELEGYFDEHKVMLYRALAEQGAGALKAAQLRDALRVSELQLRSTMDSMQDVLHVIDRDWRVVLYNSAFNEWARMIGTEGEAMGRSLFEIFPFLGEETRQAYQQVFGNGEAVLTEEAREIDGRTLHTETRRVPVLEGGQVARCITVVRDISERKQAEEERARFTNQLRTAADIAGKIAQILDPDELLQATIPLLKERFDLYHVQVYTLDEEARELVLRVGYGEAGRRMREAGHRIPLDREQSLVARAARNQEIVVVSDVTRTPHFLANPLLPNTHSEAAIPVVSGGKLLGVFDVQDDMIDRFSASDLDVFNTLAGQISSALQNARLFEEIQATAQRLREMDRLKSEFLANMSHELRTPLNSILGYTEVMMLGIDGEIDPEMLQDVAAIHENGQHLLRIINDILDLAKIEAGRMTLNLEDVELEMLLDDVRTSNLGLLHKMKSPVGLNISVAEDLPPVRADRVRLNQILNNLVSNAVKFTEKGHIDIRAYREDQWVYIEVADSGIGMDAAGLKKIFEKFQQVDGSSTRRAEGTGLGLVITRHLVQMHGGDITVKSELGKGSTFIVKLPIAALEEAAA